MKVSGDDDIPNIWKVIKVMFQTTNQYVYIYIYSPPCHLPSGKRLHNYGKIHHFLVGKSTISMAIFNSYICMFTRPGNY